MCSRIQENICGVNFVSNLISEKKKEIDILRDYKIVQHNDFIRHPRTDKLTAKEANIVYFLMSKVKPNDDNFMTIRFTINEFCRICGDDEGNGKNYRDVKDALKSLADKSAWVKTLTEKGKIKTTLVRWVDTYTITEGDGTVSATLSQSIKPYLLELRNNFTKAELRNFIAMKSMYSKRLYELLRSYIHSKPEYAYRYVFKEFEIMELKRQLNAEHYGPFKDFRVKVLEIAKREINAVSDMEMNFTAIKPRRITTHISFSIKLKDSVARAVALEQADEVIDGQMRLD